MIRAMPFLLLGCADKPGDSAAPEPEVNYTLLITGAAPWDPMRVEVDHERDGAYLEPPLADGTLLTEEVADHSGTYAWRPATPLEPGSHEIAIAIEGEAPQGHTVLPYGRDGLSADEIVGTLYRLDWSSAWLGPSDGFSALIGDQLEGVWLRLVAVDGDEADFEVLVQAVDYEVCRALSATGALSETGELSWAVDEMDITSEQGDIPLRDFSLHGGWLGDGSELGGVEATAVIHTALLSTELLTRGQPGDMCGLLAGFGASCFDCAGDGAYCADLRMHAGVMVPDAQTPLPDPLPDCGLDLDEAGDYDLSCDFPDLSCAATTFGLFGLIGALRRRRRYL